MYTSNERIALVEGMVDLLDLVGIKQNRAKNKPKYIWAKALMSKRNKS